MNSITEQYQSDVIEEKKEVNFGKIKKENEKKTQLGSAK